ncbi:hypothetical protein F7734_11430 [Scytonema sp. UIC 10036]|uniref:hypothetical protein n=1 Tax=Scytonema sp. UIC 10036 TaxID=2304196 RepID=UPI0012DA2C97|nr:hypothetical protein [Scytonema sp. UIC 10036]MUG93015.1 hypothetical protein [Scytonema sp. UIC 10036]
MNFQQQKFCLLIASIFSIFTTNIVQAIPQGGKTVIVNGTTNNGSKLGYVEGSARISGWENVREFQYVLISKDGIKVNTAYTPWCRYGKVQLDPRAIPSSDKDVHGFFDNDIKRTVGWLISDMASYGETSIFIKADSLASKNLLKIVCASTLY